MLCGKVEKPKKTLRTKSAKDEPPLEGQKGKFKDALPEVERKKVLKPTIGEVSDRDREWLEKELAKKRIELERMAWEEAKFERSRNRLKLHLESEENRLRFTALHPHHVTLDRWYTLLVYIYIPQAFEDARCDFQKRKDVLHDEYKESKTVATEIIRRETQISVIPELSGCRFNPPQAKILWFEDWHCIEFRMQILSDELTSRLSETIVGRVAFYVEPILIAEAELKVRVRSESMQVPQAEYTPSFIWESKHNAAYRNIFVSYSHQDMGIVEKLERAYTVLGDRYFRDVRMLRSGEDWNPALLRMIDLANIFQLCWSHSAKKSDSVEREWRHAITLNRRSFIRPIYWEKPLPEPPHELASIHFAYLEI